jgi:hypothetical protein
MLARPDAASNEGGGGGGGAGRAGAKGSGDASAVAGGAGAMVATRTCHGILNFPERRPSFLTLTVASPGLRLAFT